MITCLGPPPPEFVLQSPIYSEYFDEEGAWDDRIESPEISIADREANLVGHDQLPFLRFVRRMAPARFPRASLAAKFAAKNAREGFENRESQSSFIREK